MSDIYGSQLPPWLQNIQSGGGFGQGRQGFGQVGDMISALRGGQSPINALSAFTGGSGGAQPSTGTMPPALAASGSDTPAGPSTPMATPGGPALVGSQPDVPTAPGSSVNVAPGYAPPPPPAPQDGSMGAGLFSPPPMPGGTGFGGFGGGNSMPGWGR